MRENVSCICLVSRRRRRCFFLGQVGTHLFLHALSSCVMLRIGNRSFSFTSLLLPDKPTQRPGAAPSNHSLFRRPSVLPSMQREPLMFKRLRLANPLHTSKGRLRFILSTMGKPCLQVCSLPLHRQAFGMKRFDDKGSFLCIWCCAHFWFSFSACLNIASYAVPSELRTSEFIDV